MPDFFTTFGLPGDSEHDTQEGGGTPVLNEPSDLGSAGLVAAAFADQDAARMRELDVLIAADGGYRPSKTPPPQEIPMPCCSVCGTEGHNARSCSKRVDPETKAKSPAPARKSVPRAVPAPTRQDVAPTRWAKALGVMEGPELVNLRDAVTAEIRRRRDAAEKALAELNTALGDAA